MAIDSNEKSLPKTGSAPGPSDLFISILGASFSITTGEDPEYLNEVLDQYRLAVSNTQGISGMKDPLKVAILTGFLLCDEINKLKLQVEEEQVADKKIMNHAINLATSLVDKVNEIPPPVKPHQTNG